MTTAELHEILDNPQRKLTADEIKEVVFQLKQDAFELCRRSLMEEKHIREKYYSGESNAFQICLDLLEHLKGE